MSDEPFHFSREAEELVGEFRRVPSVTPRRQQLRPSRALADLVGDLVTKHRIGHVTPEETIRERWPEVVGGANAAYSHAVRLEREGRSLVVSAAHAVVRQELFHHRQAIVERLRLLPGCAGVRQLNIRAG